MKEKTDQLPITHSFTRSQVAMTVMRHKLKRPLRHKLLRRWQFRPMLAYIMKGEKQELLLHEDYVSLRLRGGAPVFLPCWDLATSTDDYNILLQDIYFIETGHEAMTSLLVNSTLLFVVGIFASVLTLAYAAASEEEPEGVHLLGGVDEADEAAKRAELRLFAAEECVVSSLNPLLDIAPAAHKQSVAACTF